MRVHWRRAARCHYQCTQAAALPALPGRQSDASGMASAWNHVSPGGCNSSNKGGSAYGWRAKRAYLLFSSTADPPFFADRNVDPPLLHALVVLCLPMKQARMPRLRCCRLLVGLLLVLASATRALAQGRDGIMMAARGKSRTLDCHESDLRRSARSLAGC